MFEKEAEKYASDLELIYKKGVLDGYNKAKEDAKKIIEDLVDFLTFLEGEQVAGILAVKRAKQFLRR
mgnify:CR=1 FL=1